MKPGIAFRTSFIVLSFLFIGGGSQVSGQKITDNRASTRSITTIAMIKKGSYLIVDAKLNGVTRKFILDGSSERTLLNSKYLYPAKDVSGKIKRHPVSTTGSHVRKDKSVEFNGIKLNLSETETMDMSYIEDATGFKIYGIVGYDLIKYFDLVFDYKGKTITLFNHGKLKGSPSPAPQKRMKWMFPFIPL